MPLFHQLRLLEILTEVRGRSRVSVKQVWYRLLGELRSMIPAIPGRRGMFSNLQLALLRHSDRTRIRLTQPIRDQIEDFREPLAQDSTSRPTSISEIIPTTPSQVGSVTNPAPVECGSHGPDSSPSPAALALLLPPILWHTTWPAPIQSQLITDTNPRGMLTNRDLELAGPILHQDVITSHIDCREATTHTMCDNVNDGPGPYLL
jgi:hypothetical protein